MGTRKSGAPRAGGGRRIAAPGTGTPEPKAPSGLRRGAGARDPLALLLDVLVLGLAAAYLAALWRQAAPMAFASDECFHARLATWIARHGRLPRELPEFYSGLPYFYPPLLHVIGAAAVKLAGVDSLRYLNVVLTGGLVAVLFAVPAPGVSPAMRRCAVLLCIANAALTLYAVRLYAETLATLLAALVVLLLLRARARPGTRPAILLGLAVGAGLLAKQPATLLPVLLAVLLAHDLARGRRPLAAAMGIALVTALVVALPFFVRNALLFASPFYPPIADPAQAALDAMNTRRFSLPAPVFYRNALITMGPIVPWLGLVALAWNLARRRFDVVTGLLAGCVALTLLVPFVPRFQPRHLNPVTAMVAVLGCIALFDALERRRHVVLVAQGALLVWAGFFVAGLTGLRAGLDAAPADREAYRAVAAHVPPGSTVLSRLTYDTAYYGGRNATWPVPWGGTAGQIELFTERDPDRFLSTLDRLGIAYLLMPRRTREREFNGSNYPESFVDCVAALEARGRLTVVWGSADQVLVQRAK